MKLFEQKKMRCVRSQEMKAQHDNWTLVLVLPAAKKSFKWFCSQKNWGFVRICPTKSHIGEPGLINDRGELGENSSFHKLYSLQKHEDVEFEETLVVEGNWNVARSLEEALC